MVLVSQGLSCDMINPEIGLKHLSDHATVIITWKMDQLGKGKVKWRLKNCLLEVHGRVVRIELEIKECFTINRGSSITQIAWEAFISVRY